MAWLRLAIACLCSAGCTIAENSYPVAWESLDPPAADHCRGLLGSYADRGERTDEPTKPSLTLQLFGEHSDWEQATRVELAMADANTLDVTAWSGEKRLEFVSLRNDKGDFSCDRGRLIVYSRRWIATYVLSGRQRMTIELIPSGRNVVAEVDELSYGLIFIIWPIAGQAQHWYRFARL